MVTIEIKNICTIDQLKSFKSIDFYWAFSDGFSRLIISASAVVLT